MRIGILVLSVGSSGQRKFYNLQEIGLAKALDAYCEKVRVWRLVPHGEDACSEKIAGYKNVTIEFLPSRCIGTNGFMDCSKLDRDLDALICFADTQVTVPMIYRWAKRNKVLFLPYIGVVQSHSTKAMRQKIINALFARNLRVYRKSCCLAKTPDVEAELRKQGISQIIVAPVGLDRTLLKPDYEQYGSEEIKEKYGFQKRDRIILFIGRLTEEKQPLRMVKLFAYIFERDKDFRLLMVGTGEQGDNVAEVIEAYNLGERVRRIERISNSEIWEIYRFSEVFVNLNQQEIFGMAILEAMYYGCKVVAWKAPGPDFIIENGISGWIVENEEQLLCRVLEENEESRSDFMIVNARKRIIRDFTWDSIVQKILLYIREAS